MKRLKNPSRHGEGDRSQSGGGGGGVVAADAAPLHHPADGPPPRAGEDFPATRADVVREALSWEGTPYHPHARIKGVGCDCAQFPAAVYHAVGLIPDLQPDYSSQWMLHRDEEQFLAWVTPFACEIGRDEVAPGDFVIWKFGRTYAHGAIVIDPPEIIHAVIAGGAVVRGNMDRDGELQRPVRFFTLFGGDDGR